MILVAPPICCTRQAFKQNIEELKGSLDHRCNQELEAEYKPDNHRSATSYQNHNNRQPSASVGEDQVHGGHRSDEHREKCEQHEPLAPSKLVESELRRFHPCPHEAEEHSEGATHSDRV